MKVLWFDDEADVLRLCSEALIKKGYDVITSRTCANMFELIEEGHPDVIIMDNRIPGSNGIEAILKIKETPYASISILYCSADTMANQQALQAGATACVGKPFSIREIESCLKKIKDV